MASLHKSIRSFIYVTEYFSFFLSSTIFLFSLSVKLQNTCVHISHWPPYETWMCSVNSYYIHVIILSLIVMINKKSIRRKDDFMRTNLMDKLIEWRLTSPCLVSAARERTNIFFFFFYHYTQISAQEPNVSQMLHRSRKCNRACSSFRMFSSLSDLWTWRCCSLLKHGPLQAGRRSTRVCVSKHHLDRRYLL